MASHADLHVSRRGISTQLSSGALTLFGSMAIVRLLSIISIAILGRLLTPEDFGIVALAAFVTGLLNQVVGRHFENVLIRTVDVHQNTLGLPSYSPSSGAVSRRYLQ